MSKIEQEYAARIDAMSIVEKMERSVAMFNWTREMIGRQIKAEKPGISDERLRWEVAYRQYADEPQARNLVERMLARVPS